MKIRIVHRLPTPKSSVVVAPCPIRVQSRPMRVLDFDIENRPLSYLGSDFTTAEVTAIAWAWTDAPTDVTAVLLGEMELPAMLAAFVAAWEQADLITGHYCLGHDIPMVNAALMEQQMPPLSDKMVQDTKVHLVRGKGISRSQESLSAMFELQHPKQPMNQALWRSANRLTPEGLAEVRRRVVGDVQQHIELREELLRLGYLAAPKLWRSGSAALESYVP